MTTLTEGQVAPAIEGINQSGDSIKLENYKGKKVILYFYPKDDTPGCTTESCNLRDNYKVLQDKGFEILGVSNDDEKKHQKFIDKYDLPFDLIADVDKTIVNEYGVYGLKKFMGKEFMGINRTTFVIDEEGKIEKIITKVNNKDHSNQILTELGMN